MPTFNHYLINISKTIVNKMSEKDRGYFGLENVCLHKKVERREPASSEQGSLHVESSCL